MANYFTQEEVTITENKTDDLELSTKKIKISNSKSRKSWSLHQFKSDNFQTSTATTTNNETLNKQPSYHTRNSDSTDKTFNANSTRFTEPESQKSPIVHRNKPAGTGSDQKNRHNLIR